jgi:tight adherence protein B
MSSALFESTWGLVGLGLAVGCLVLLATLTALARPRTAWMRNRIAVYSGDQAVGVDDQVKVRVHELFTLTERKLNRTGLWRRLERLIERAAVGLRPVELLYLCAAAGIGLGTLTVATGMPGAVVLVAIAVGAVVLPVYLALRGQQRLRRFDDQLPDTLLGIASALKVGHSFDTAVQAIVDRGQSPTSNEFAHLVSDTKLGRTMDEALDAMAMRIGSRELDFVLMSVRIQRQVGGTLASLFETVAQTVQERRHFKAKVRALTATGRMTAHLLTALPILTAVVILAMSPGYLEPMIESTTGLTVLVLAGVGLVFGACILRRIVTVKG